MKALMAAAQKALASAGLWRRDARFLCAVSGGADSMALLHTMRRLQEEMPFSLAVVHVQHGLRGESSLQDERFVREWCQRLDVPLHVQNAGLKGDMHTPGIELEARKRRRAIFAEQMHAFSADAVLTAHHRDDQAETVLMHLLRGAGADGLRGMRQVAPFGCGLLVRPFLTVERDALRSALAAENLLYREDESNAESVTARNALRLHVLPQLERLFPGAKGHIAQAAQLIQADADDLDGQAQSLYREALYAAPPLFMLNRTMLARNSASVRRRVLRLWWSDGLRLAGLAPDERMLGCEDTFALEGLTGRRNLPMGLLAQAGERWLHLLRQDGEPLVKQAPYELSALSAQVPHLTLCLAEAQGIPASAGEIVLTPDMLGQNPVFRLPRHGDRIRPIGAPGAKPLRRYFTDRKVDPALRQAWPVLAVGSDIWWIPGLCAAECLRLTHLPNDSVRLMGVPDFDFERP